MKDTCQGGSWKCVEDNLHVASKSPAAAIVHGRVITIANSVS